MSHQTNGVKHALILSGGGANGAYEIGVLKALFAGKSKTTGYKPIDPDFFFGTSVGAFNAAFLVSHWGELGSSSISNLERVWLNSLCSSTRNGANGVFRIVGNPLDLLKPASYFPNPAKPLLQAISGGATLAWDGVQRVANLADQRTSVLERVVNLVNFSSFISVAPLKRAIETRINFADIRTSTKELRIAATNWGQGETTLFAQNEMTDNLGPQVILASTAIPG